MESKIEEDINEEEKDKIDKILKDSSPLKFVDTIEHIYQSLINKSSEKKNFRILSSYKQNHQMKCDLIDFEIKTNNSSKITKKIKEINCIKIIKENIYIGVKDGKVYMYEIESGLEKETFGIENFNIPVSVINNKENIYLIIGYENGAINIFDMKNTSLIKSIIDIHKTKILSLEYILIEKNNIQLLSSDEECQVINISSYTSFLIKKNIGNLLYKDVEPIYSITRFKPFEDKKVTIFGFNSKSKIRLYNLKLVLILEIKKPKFAEKNDIPEIAFGWGILPQFCEDNYSKINEMKNDNKVLFIVGWGRIIYIYSVFIKGDNIKIEEPIGFYKNDLPIIKLGFYNSSIIYFFDENKQLRVINTAFCNFGLYDENKIINKYGLVDEGKIVDKNIKYNEIKITEEKKFNNYRNFIFSMNKYIYIFTNDGLRKGKILGFIEYIDNLIANNNWKAAMCLAIDIYKGKIINFPGIPYELNERKKILNLHLIDLLNKYIDYNFDAKSDNYDDNDEYINNNSDDNFLEKNIMELNEDKIIECINTSIEFCLEINSIDYLLKDVEPTFSKYGKEDLFYKLLEPFIFNDLFYNENIGIEALTSLYGAYKIKEETALLSHLLIHINLKCLNNFMIKKISVQENLFDLIIYIFSNGSTCEDFFLPITKMFEYFKKNNNSKYEIKEESKEDNDNKFYSYYDLYITKGLEGINQMEKTKEYIGHKLLWYIDMCIRGNKFSSDIDLIRFRVDSKEYIKFIAYIYFWILHEDVFLTLLKFDSYTLFSILNYFFTEKNITNIIKNFDFKTITAKYLNALLREQESGAYFVRNMKINIEKEKEKKKEKKEENEEEQKEVDNDENENNQDSEEKEEIKDDKNYDPFAIDGIITNYGTGVKLNDLNNVLDYIIILVESQDNFISKLDLSTFLIKYVSKGEEKITEKLHKKILDSFLNCLNFFSEYQRRRKDLILKNEDKFNIHHLNKKALDTQDSYFIAVSNMLSDLLSSNNITFTEEELFKIKLASGKPFKIINIKIAELAKNYKDCIKLFLEEEIPKLRENVFNWIDDKFEYFKNELSNKDLQENELNDIKKSYNKFIEALIEQISELVKIRLDKTKKFVGNHLNNNDKLKIYNNLKGNPQEQFAFLELLLYQEFEKIKEEEKMNEINGEEKKNEKNIDLFQIYISNMSDEYNFKQEKIIRDQFDKLLIDQIKLLYNLKRSDEIIKYLKINIQYYPTFPLREALNICIEKDIIDGAIYIYQVLNENRSSLNLTLQNLEKSFNNLKKEPKKEESNFLDKLELCINICKENSELILKKDPKEKGKKDNDSEGEELWFDLLKKLYDLDDKLNETENKWNAKAKEILQKGIGKLLKEICDYVRIQKLISYVTDKQEKAQYKEYKTILETMLRSNNSFDRVLNSVMTILKNSIQNSESTRKKVTSKGNNYNIKKCDVCNNFFQNSKDEIIYFFGCGHQSHENCCYKKRNYSSKNINNIRINSKENEDGSFAFECEVCRKNRIENENKVEDEDEFENFIMNEDKEINDDIVINNERIKMKAFKYENKKDKFKKLDKYDIKYQNETSIF